MTMIDEKVVAGHKVCTKCRESKPRGAFCAHINRGRHGLRPNCRECESAYYRSDAYRAKANARAARRREMNPRVPAEKPKPAVVISSEEAAGLPVRQRARIYPLRPIKVVGDIGFVPLSQGHTAMIDAEDAERVGLRNWSFRMKQKQLIAHSNFRLECGRYVPIPLHRFIMSAEPGTLIDHINGNPLDNRKANLRFADSTGNAFNSKRRTDNTSGYKGVTFDKRRGLWQARIKAGDAREYLGYFDTPEAAHAAYVSAALRLHGKFARVA